MAQFCDLSTAHRLRTWVDEGLERMQRLRSRPDAQGLQVVHLTREIGELGPSAPYQPGSSWAEAIQATFDHLHAGERARLAQQGDKEAQAAFSARRLLWTRELATELDQVLRRGDDYLIPPERLWGDPEVRAFFQQTMALQDRNQIYGQLRDWLASLGYQWRGELLGRRTLRAGLVAAYGWADRPQGAAKLLFQPVRSGGVMDKEAAEMLLAVVEQPEEYPRLAERLKNLLGESVRISDRLDLLWRTLGPIVARHNHGIPTRLTTAEIYTWLWPKLSETERVQVTKALRQAGFPESPDVVAELALELHRALAKDVEEYLEKLPVRFRALRAFLAPIRATDRIMGLIRPAFLLENYAEAQVKQLLAGRTAGGPRVTAEEYRAYVRALAHQLHYPVSAEALRRDLPHTWLDRQLERVGIEELPQAVAATWERIFAQPEFQTYSPATAPIWQVPLVTRLAGEPPPPPEARARLLATMGLDVSRGEHRWWQKPARAVVMPLAHVMAWVRVFATAQEAAFRKQAFVARVIEFMEQGGEAAWAEQVKRLFTFHLLEESDAERYLAQFDELLERTPAAAHQLARRLFPNRPTLARQLGHSRARLLRQAEEEGIREANRIHFDYLHKTKLDEVASDLLKYHTWATRNLVFYVEEMARHAVLYRLFGRSLALSQEEAEAGERPAGAAEMVDLGEGGPWGIVFGPQVRFYASLWSLIGLFAQVDASPSPRRGTVYDQLVGEIQPLGLTPNFDVRLLANIFGYSTTGDPPRMNPYTGALARSTGIDLTFPLTEAVRALRARLSGRLPGSEYVTPETLSGSVSYDRAIWRELIAMSVEETGRPNDRRYLIAMADPDDPLFQEAMRRVSRRRVPLELFNLTSPVRGEVATETERELAQASRARPWPTDEEEFSRRVALGDPSMWILQLPSDLREAQIKAGFALTQELATQGRLPNPEYLAEKLPWFVAYQVWAQDQEPGERSVNRFLREHRSLPIPD